MDIRDPTWKHRYDELGFRIDPAIESFCLGELELFDRAMQSYRAPPKLEKYFQDFRARVADPLSSILVFEATTLPLTTEHAQIAAERYATLQSAVAGIHPAMIPQDARNTLEQEKQRADLWKSYDEEIKQKYKFYLDFVVKELGQEIIRRQQSSSIITLDDSAPLMRAVTVRHEIYRTALRSKERAWLFGWDIATVAKHICATSEEIAHHVQAYNELKDEAPELIPKNQRKELMLSPHLGSIETTLENVYENLHPQQPSVEESTAFQRAVTNYIANRVKEIYA